MTLNISLSDWVNIYPQISTVFFFLLFAVIVFVVFRYDKKSIKEWKSLPLDDEKIIDN
jgi:cbb3-type cytochrome oxidase subunit 3